jgi:hypothetical protein
MPPAHTPLTVNQWMDGNITTSGGWAWYSFNAAANTTYGVWLNGSSWNGGDGSKTMNAIVRAYDNNGTILFDNFSGFHFPNTINLTTGGMVYLRVTGSGTGTFGLIYGTSIVRPDLGHTPLTESQWTHSSINTPGGVAWYSFPAAAGTPYAIWWNDSNHGDGTKTLPIRVRAYDSSGTELFNHDGSGAWNSARTVNLISGGTVFLRVTARWDSNSTGTFAIGYSTGPRP